MDCFTHFSQTADLNSSVLVGNKMIKIEVSDLDPVIFPVNNTKTLFTAHHCADSVSRYLGFHNTREWRISADSRQCLSSMVDYLKNHGGTLFAKYLAHRGTVGIKQHGCIHKAWAQSLHDEMLSVVQSNKDQIRLDIDPFSLIKRSSPKAHKDCTHPSARFFIEDAWPSIYEQIKSHFH